MRKLPIALIAAVVIAAGVFWAAGVSGGREAVAYVDGEPIAPDEYRLFVLKDRALTSGTELQDKALKQAVGWKAFQLWAKQEGLTDDIRYAAFQKELRGVNASRSAAIRAGEAVFGPERLDEASYLDMKEGEWKTALIDKLIERGSYSEDRKQAYYAAHKTADFVRPASVEVAKLFVPREGEDGDAALDEAPDMLTEVKAQLDQGLTWEEAAAGLKQERQRFDDKSAAGDRLRPELLAQAMRLPEGGTSGVFADAGGYYLIHCLERTGGYYSYEEARGGIPFALAMEDFEAELERRAQEADVDVDERALKRISLQ